MVQIALNVTVKADQVSANFRNCIFSSNQMQKIENGIKGGIFVTVFFILEVIN